MTDADEVRAKLDWALTDLGSAITIVTSLEATIERIKAIIEEVGHGTTNMDRDTRLRQALNRTLQELSSMYNRFQMLKPSMEEWRNSV